MLFLTVEFHTSLNADQNERKFTFEQLQALPKATFITSTIWTDGLQEFTGVWMHALLQELDVKSGNVELVALNDYRVSVPFSEFVKGGALLAYERNKLPMTTRQNGPLWLVYNYDSDPSFSSESIYAQSIWQLDRIIISR